MDFAANLKRLRQERKLSQEQLALKCGWSGQSRIANYESTSPNAREPKASDVWRLAQALECSVDELFGAPPAQASHPATLDLDRLGVALTAMDKALADQSIQGKLGTLAYAVGYAYDKAFQLLKDPNSKSERDLFDEIVAQNLRGWSGRSGDTEEGTREHREAAATKAANRSGER